MKLFINNIVAVLPYQFCDTFIHYAAGDIMKSGAIFKLDDC